LTVSSERTRVEIQGCACTYPGQVKALHRSDLTVEPGEVMALLGPSGCGKTTLLRVVAGLADPDPGGVVRFNGEDVTARPIEQRAVGMVFQHYALFPQMDVQANIGYGLRVRGLDVALVRARVGELVDLMRLQGLEHRRPAELSGGQRQRVALARAVAVRPRVLLLDEPLTALDAKLKETLRDELAQLLRQLGITALHVTHDQQEAMAIADRMAVMQAGRIIQLGAPEDLYRRPGHPFVAEFLGRVNRLARSPQDVAAGQVCLGGLVLQVPPAVGSAADLLLRPEDVQVGPVQTQAGVATVLARRFMGDHVRLQLGVEGQQVLMVDVPHDTPAQVGDRVGIQVDPGRLMSAQMEESA
jgi:putative spermidine/putrescine transport system ATP-binding protein